ncbi:hypothetical protein [Streptomyces fagopyri]|uniref:hypothetical protein n=1 Tax=Streptomyces fagopyri TaxID=2662397 RepID=UPI0033F40ED1
MPRSRWTGSRNGRAQVDQARAAAGAAGHGEWRYATALRGRATGDRGWDLDPTEPGPRMYGPRDTGTDAGVPSHGLALLTRLPVRTGGSDGGPGIRAAPVGTARTARTAISDHRPLVVELPP